LQKGSYRPILLKDSGAISIRYPFARISSCRITSAGFFARVIRLPKQCAGYFTFQVFLSDFFNTIDPKRPVGFLESGRSNVGVQQSLELVCWNDGLGLCLRTLIFNAITTKTNTRQLPTTTSKSPAFGGRIRKNPLPFISDEKLETQKGMRNNRVVCQGSALLLPGPLTLRSNAKPITADSPRELSQIAGVVSK
jgi:hypothetical protein